MQPVSIDFYARDTLIVARELVGAELRHGEFHCRIVETEAYTDDAASHYVTRPRTGAMLGDTHGLVYVYRIYGIHRCLNFTTDATGPGAALIRAVEPLSHLDLLRSRRPGRPDRELANGPAKLFVALGLDEDLHRRPVPEVLPVCLPPEPPVVETSPRIGISAARDLPWRFTLAGSAWLSRRR